MKITINIHPAQEEAVLDAFATADGRSEAIVETAVKEIIAGIVAEQAAGLASVQARAAVQDVIKAKRDEVAADFGVTLPDPRRGPPGAPGRPR